MAWDYQQRRTYSVERARTESQTGRDIGPLPEVAEPDRRQHCKDDLREFCETYMPMAFNLAWSSDHLKVIGIMQNAILKGGLFAVAMPRGNGKTTLAVAAAIWALLNNHRSWVVLIGATDAHAGKLLQNIMVHFESNADLLADYPEAVYPVRRLDRVAQRAKGQLLDGDPTRIGWTAKELILPTVEGSPVSGSRVTVTGITGAVRGLQATLADGSVIRPDFVLIDDPQTGESAHSHEQCERRLEIIRGDILGLAGNRTKISAVAPLTVVVKGDLADQLLDRKKCPEWQGVKTALMHHEPTNVKLWEQYAEVWADGHRQEKGLGPATEFYRVNRDALDAGAEPAWPERHNEDEISAVQSAMNLKLRGEASFYAEYQNDPVSLEAEQAVVLKADQVLDKVVEIKRGIVPTYATKLVAMCDVQGSILYYAVAAFDDDYRCHVVDYGTYPKQSKSYFFLREVDPSLATVTPEVRTIPQEGQLRAGLDVLIGQLLDRDYVRDDGGKMRIGRLVIDAGWQGDVIKQAVAESKHKALIMPSRGWGLKPEMKPLDQWESKLGDRRGWSWLYKRAENSLFFDANLWKTFLAERIKAAKGLQASLTVFAGSRTAHKMFADHLTSEWSQPVTAAGRTIAKWDRYPNRENHFLDCVIGCMVAASEQGAAFIGHQPQSGQKASKRRKFNVRW
ncbi:MAG: terminase gpA endonuclease subunit [Janthinobacterium lividum]